MADMTPIDKRIMALQAKLEAERTRPIGDFFPHLDDPEYKAEVDAYFVEARRIMGAE